MTIRPPIQQRTRWSSTGGFTMIEVLVAMVVLVIGLLALVGAFDGARKLTLLSEQRTEMAHRAQFEIERLQATSFAKLAMNQKNLPLHSSEEANPDYYVKEGTPRMYQYGSAELEVAKLESSEEGEIEPSPKGRECSSSTADCEWVNGNASGSVYDFVTRVEKEGTLQCSETEECPKRLTVVVTAKVGSGKAPAPIRVSTIITKPVSSSSTTSSSTSSSSTSTTSTTSTTTTSSTTTTTSSTTTTTSSTTTTTSSTTTSTTSTKGKGK